VLLEIARQLQATQPPIGVDIIFWDAEDLGDPNVEDSYALGSQYWGKNPHKPGYTADYGINLDMVGASRATFLMEGYSYQTAREVVLKVWQSAQGLGHGNYFLFHPQPGPSITDDHVYVNKLTGIPCIDVIDLRPRADGLFFEHWHTHEDDMSVIDRNTLRAVGETMLHVIFSENPQ
jgi:Zn-dependent M28 family amino/carboxypeptidase